MNDDKNLFKSGTTIISAYTETALAQMRRNFLTKCNGRIRHRFTMHARLWYQNLWSCYTFINRVLRHRAYEILSS